MDIISSRHFSLMSMYSFQKPKMAIKQLKSYDLHSLRKWKVKQKNAQVMGLLFSKIDTLGWWKIKNLK